MRMMRMVCIKGFGILSCVPSIGLENDWEGSPLGWKSSRLSVFEGIAFQRLSAVSGDSGTTEDERND